MKPKAIAFILMLLALVGIAGSIHEQVEPVPKSTVAQSAPVEDDDDGGFCSPCLGPHLNLSKGNIELMPSLGPGVEF